VNGSNKRSGAKPQIKSPKRLSAAQACLVPQGREAMFVAMQFSSVYAWPPIANSEKEDS